MGLSRFMVEVLGHTAIFLSLNPNDPNVDPDYSLCDDNGSWLNPAHLPPHIKEVRTIHEMTEVYCKTVQTGLLWAMHGT